MLFYLILIGIGVLAGVLINILINKRNPVYSVIGSIILLISGAIACFVLYYPYYFYSFSNLIWMLATIAVFLIAVYSSLYIIVNAIKNRSNPSIVSDTPVAKTESTPYKTVRLQKAKPDKARKKMMGNVEVTRLDKASFLVSGAKKLAKSAASSAAKAEDSAVPSSTDTAAHASQGLSAENIGATVTSEKLTNKPGVEEVAAEPAQYDAVEENAKETVQADIIKDTVIEPAQTIETTFNLTQAEAMGEAITESDQDTKEVSAEPIQTVAAEELASEPAQEKVAEENTTELVQSVATEPAQTIAATTEPSDAIASEDAITESVHADVIKEVTTESEQSETVADVITASEEDEPAEEISESAQTETGGEFVITPEEAEIIDKPAQVNVTKETAAESAQAVAELVQAEVVEESATEIAGETAAEPAQAVAGNEIAVKPVQAEPAEETVTQPDRFTALFTKAEELLKESKYNYAAQIAEACLEIAPTSQRKRVDIMLLECLVLSNQVEKARKKWLEVLNKMYILEPDDKQKLKKILKKLNNNQRQVS